MDALARKKTLRRMTNGMYILTSRFEEEYGAATVTWVSQVSFKPPLIMAAVRQESSVYKCLSRSLVAAIHVLSVDDQNLAQKFFAPTKIAEGTINTEPFMAGKTSAPILRRVPTFIECKVTKIVDTGGDHALVVLEAVEVQCGQEIAALTINDSPWEYGG